MVALRKWQVFMGFDNAARVGTVFFGVTNSEDHDDGEERKQLYIIHQVDSWILTIERFIFPALFCCNM